MLHDDIFNNKQEALAKGNQFRNRSTNTNLENNTTSSNFKPQKEVDFEWDTLANDWQYVRTYLYSYDSYGRIRVEQDVDSTIQDTLRITNYFSLFVDSTITEYKDPFNNLWSLNYIDYNYRDSNNNDTLTLQLRPNGVSFDTSAAERSEITYNVNNKISQKIIYMYSQGNGYMYQYKYLFDYAVNGEYVDESFYIWNGSAFIENSRGRGYYDVLTNNIIADVGFDFNGTFWYPTDSSTAAYSNNLVIMRNSYHYDLSNNTWSPYRYITYQYTSNLSFINTVRNFDAANQSWNNEFRVTSVNDNCNNRYFRQK